ncbi:MAG: copper resistance protein CopC, partial [Nocardioidaceae bacterium]
MPDPPGRVLLRFSESVAVSSTSVRVLDHHGETVVGKGAAHVKGNDAEVVLALPDLEEGTYVATWRVVSADSHPAVGAISFRIGKATDDFHIGAGLLEAPKGDGAVGTTFGVVRFLLFASVILLVGSTAFLAGLWPAGWARPGARRLVRGAWLGALVSTLSAIALQGAYSTGGGLADLLSPTVLADVLRSRYGDASAARVVLLLDAGVLVLLLRRCHQHRPVARRAVLGVGAVGGLALLLSISWIGHASTGRFSAAAMTLDVAHLTAVSVWLGGLATLGVLVLRRRSNGDVEQAEAVAARFSSLAFAAVVVIVVTGSLQSWRQLDGLGEFTSTTFGRLLLSK